MEYHGTSIAYRLDIKRHQSFVLAIQLIPLLPLPLSPLKSPFVQSIFTKTGLYQIIHIRQDI